MRGLLKTSDPQFACKNELGTEMSVLALKHLTDLHNKNILHGYVQIWQSLPHKDRKKTDLPMFIIDISDAWYKSQQLFVKWGASCLNRLLHPAG